MRPAARLWWRFVRAVAEIAFHEGAHWARVAERRLRELDR